MHNESLDKIHNIDLGAYQEPRMNEGIKRAQVVYGNGNCTLEMVDRKL